LRSANRVILASAGSLPTLDQVKKNAQVLDERTSPLGVWSDELLPRFSTRKDWPDNAKVLTD
jgi:hypothetical protein